MIQRKQQAVSLQKGRWAFTVWEANWDMSATPDIIRKEASKGRSGEDVDYDLVSFHESIYPWLAAYSKGNVPTLQEAFELPDDDLDLWYEAVKATNTDLFPEGQLPPTILTLRDKSQIVIHSAHLPSCLRRLAHLDNQAHSHLAQHPDDSQEFARMKVYAKMAGCSTGDVPTYLEALEWPSTELSNWYEAVLRTNPQLFLLQDPSSSSLEDPKKNSVQPPSSATSQASSRKPKTSLRK